MLRIKSAQIFDWIVTPDRGLVTLVESDLDGFFGRDRLGLDPSGGVVDLPTDTRFLHEFPTGCDVDAQHALHAGRYAMLARRWHEMLASNQRVLFVRQHAWDTDPRSSAARLREAIRSRAPGLRFAILYLTENPADEVSWHQEGIINRHLTQPEPYDWKGDHGAWERLLGDALSEEGRA